MLTGLQFAGVDPVAYIDWAGNVTPILKFSSNSGNNVLLEFEYLGGGNLLFLNPQLTSSGNAFSFVSDELTPSFTNSVLMSFSTTVNGSGSGGYTGLKLSISELSLPSGSNRLIDCYTGPSGLSNVFWVDRAGNVVLNGESASAVTNSPYIALLGTFESTSSGAFGLYDEDQWLLTSILQNAPNGNSILTFEHNGTPGLAAVSVPALIIANSFTPASSSAPGVTGQIAYDSQYLYVCISGSTPKWGRASLQTTGW
jgi:hypothetical protein